MKTLIVGLGNPILGDDGVGWKVAEEIKKHLPEDMNVDVECASLGGLSLMERLIGYHRAILIDAIAVDDEIGSISILNLDQLPNYSAYHITSGHDTSLQNAMLLGKSMGAQLPNEVTVIGIATRHIYDFSEELSPLIASKVPLIVKIALDLVAETVKARNKI